MRLPRGPQSECQLTPELSRAVGVGFNELLAVNTANPESTMSKKLHVGCSPLTGTIFAGNVLKDGRTWGAGKQDVTLAALVAVAEHATNFGKPVEITGPDGKLVYRITVEAF